MGWSAKFAEENATLHGVDRVATAPQVSEKMLWLTVIVLSLSIMCYEGHITIREYLSEPVAVALTEYSVDIVPPVLICPSVWYDLEKLSKIGDPLQVYRYWISHYLEADPLELQLVDPEAYGIHVRPISNSTRDVLTNDLEFHKQLAETLNAKYQSPKHFLLDIMREPADVFENNYGLIPTKYDKSATAQGGCYLQAAQKLAPIVTPFLFFDTWLKNPEPPFGIKRSAEKLYFGETASSSEPDGRLDIESGTDVIVYLYVKKYKKVNTKRKPCAEEGLRAQLGCLLTCVNRRMCTGCKLLDTFSATGNFSNLCSVQGWYINFEHCGVEMYFKGSGPEMGLCREECPFSCEKTQYSYTVIRTSGVSTPGSNTTGIRFRFHRPFEAQYLEESRVYSWETLVCNVGGIVSLFCGASVISIVQLLVFMARRCSGRSKQQSTVEQQ